MSRIITIGREFGSDGRELGIRLAQELNISFYDQEIVTEIARRTELPEQYVRTVAERRPGSTFFGHMEHGFENTGSLGTQQSKEVYEVQSSLLKELAQKSDCVIVGRCADYYLREFNPLRLFVYASLEGKLARCRARNPEARDLSDKELLRQIRTMDKQRGEYYTFVTGQKWGDPLNYDLCVNTTGRDIGKLAASIARLF